jgi:hypothetical protein
MAVVDVKDGANEVTILLDGDSADISAGDHGKNGDVVLKDQEGEERIRIGWITEPPADPSDRPSVTAKYWGIRVRTAEGAYTIEIGSRQSVFGGSDMLVAVGGGGAPGTLLLRDEDGKQVMRVDGSDGRATFGGSGEKGQVILQDGAGNSVKLSVAGDDQLVLVGPSGDNRLLLDATKGNLWVGGNGANGDVLLRPSAATSLDTTESTIHLDGNAATLRLGLEGQAGKILVRDIKGDDVFRVESSIGSHLFVGTVDNGALVHVVNSDGQDSMLLDSIGILSVGTSQGGTSGRVNIYDDAGNQRLALDGKTGDIKLSGADCAEQFEVADLQEITPGCVLVLGEHGKLRPCAQAYDKRVVGVVSGAGGLSPGIILGETSASGERSPVAITGKVYCKVDARAAPIEQGDLLTTSATPGHAMKVLDPARALGTVIGKALTGLADGCSLLPILVTLR